MARPNKGSRRARKGLAFGLIAAVALVGALAAAARPAAGALVSFWLRTSPYGSGGVEVRSLSLNTLAVERFWIAGGDFDDAEFRLQRLEASFTPWGLARGRLKRLEIWEPRLLIGVDETGALQSDLLAPGDDANDASSGGITVTEAPIKSLVIHDGGAVVETPAGWLRCALNAEIDLGGVDDAGEGGAARFEITPTTLVAPFGDVRLKAGTAQLDVGPGAFPPSLSWSAKGAASVEAEDGAGARAVVDAALAPMRAAAPLAPFADRLARALGEAAQRADIDASVSLNAPSRVLSGLMGPDAYFGGGGDEPLDGDVQLRVAGGEAASAALRASLRLTPASASEARANGDAPLFALESDWDVEAQLKDGPALKGRGTVAGGVAAGGDLAGAALNASLDAPPWAEGDAVVGPLALVASARQMTPEQWIYDVTARAEAAGAFEGLGALEAVVAAPLSGDVDFPAAAARIAGGCLEGAVTFAHADGDLDSAAIDALTVCPLTDKASLASLDWKDGVKTRLAAAIDAASVSAGLGDLKVSGAPPSLALEGSVEGDAARLNLSASGGDILVRLAEASDGDVKLGDINLSATYSGALSAPEQGEGRLTLARLRLNDPVQPRRFMPIAVAGSGRMDAGRAEGDVRLRALDAQLLRVTGDHDFTAATGAVHFDTDRLSFGPGGVDLPLLVPALKQTLTSVGGVGSAAGRLAWSDDGLVSSGRALLDDVSVELSAAKISGVNGEATLASLLPPTTNGYQRLRIDSVVAGIELTGGVIDYALGADGLARISRADWKWGGGRLGVYDAVAALDGTELRAPVEVRGVDLSAVLGALNVEGLSGDGRLTGVFPVALTDGRLQVKDGRLSSEADGVLRYSGPQEAVALGVSAEQSKLLFGALSNFQYKSIVMSLNGAVDDALTLKLTLDGANPDFLDGYPFKINLTTRADVSDVFKSD